MRSFSIHRDDPAGSAPLCAECAAVIWCMGFWSRSATGRIAGLGATGRPVLRRRCTALHRAVPAAPAHRHDAYCRCARRSLWCMGFCPSIPHLGVQCLGAGVACGLGQRTGHRHGPGLAAPRRSGAWGFARAFRTPGCRAWERASRADLASAPDIGTDLGWRRGGGQVHGVLPERSALRGAVSGGRRRMRTWPARRTSARTWAGGAGAFRCMGFCPSVPHSGVQCVGAGVECGLGQRIGHRHGAGPAAPGRSGAWGVARHDAGRRELEPASAIDSHGAWGLTRRQTHRSGLEQQVPYVLAHCVVSPRWGKPARRIDEDRICHVAWGFAGHGATAVARDGNFQLEGSAESHCGTPGPHGSPEVRPMAAARKALSGSATSPVVNQSEVRLIQAPRAGAMPAKPAWDQGRAWGRRDHWTFNGDNVAA